MKMTTKELMAHKYCFHLLKQNINPNEAKHQTRAKFGVLIPKLDLEELVRASKIIDGV